MHSGNVCGITLCVVCSPRRLPQQRLQRVPPRFFTRRVRPLPVRCKETQDSYRSFKQIFQKKFQLLKGSPSSWSLNSSSNVWTVGCSDWVICMNVSRYSWLMIVLAVRAISLKFYWTEQRLCVWNEIKGFCANSLECFLRKEMLSVLPDDTLERHLVLRRWR